MSYKNCINTNLDLDLENYSYQDLLSLFNINELTQSSLKLAYKIVIRTHPDKSGLNKDFFLFFSKAFKYLKNIYDIQEKHVSFSTITKDMNLSYDEIANEQCINEVNIHQEEIQNKIKDKKFTKWFNTIFEKIKIHDSESDNGYDKWFRSHGNPNEDYSHESISSLQQMNEFILKKKRENRELIKYQDLQTINDINSGNYQIARNNIENYSSGIFNKLQYEDLKKAHTETVIPVTDEDIRKQYHNVNDLMKERDSLKRNELQHEEIFANHKRIEQEDNIKRTYDILNQMEETKRAQQSFWSYVKQIKN